MSIYRHVLICILYVSKQSKEQSLLSWAAWLHTFPWKLESYLSSVLSKLRMLVSVWKTPATIHWHQDCLKLLLSGRTTSIFMGTTSWYWLVCKFVCKSNSTANRLVYIYILIYKYVCVPQRIYSICISTNNRTICHVMLWPWVQLYILPLSSYLTISHIYCF